MPRELPKTMLPGRPRSSISDSHVAHDSALNSWPERRTRAFGLMDLILSSADVSMPPVPQAGSRMLMTWPAPAIVSMSGAISRFTIRSMTSRGVKWSVRR
jgi:hypothetical protein